MLWLMAGLAWAASVDDVAVAAQRGMSPEVLSSLLAELGEASSEDVVTLLRSGVTAEAVALAIPGHPTAEELQAAEDAGPLVYTPPPKEYRGISARAWFPLVGSELVFRIGDETMQGTLVAVEDVEEEMDTLLVAADGAVHNIERYRVSSVRRVDGAPIAVATDRDIEEREIARYEPAPSRSSSTIAGARPLPSKQRRTGNALLATGGTLTAVGILSLVAYQGQMSSAWNSAYDGDVEETTERSTSAATWGLLGWSCLISGLPSATAGIVLIATDD